MKDIHLDAFDLAILGALEADARQPFVALAERVGLSKSPCWSRVQTLERSGAIVGYRAEIDPGGLGLGLTAFVEVSIDFGAHAEFERMASAHPAVLACWTTAGEGDYLLQIAAADVQGLDALLRHDFRSLPGVRRMTTRICLKPIKVGGRVTDAAALMRRREGRPT